ncbi:MAG: cupredoxin domain-containing protein [Methyloligellaceae bacterium]
MSVRSASARLTALAIVLAAVPAIDAHGRDAKKVDKEKICQDAEARYQKLFGKPSKDEQDVVVLMYKYTFCPSALEVKQGAKIRWVNVDKRTSHSVWFKEAGKAESDRVFGEEHVPMTADLPLGTYPFICGPHGKRQGMRGTLTIVP